MSIKISQFLEMAEVVSRSSKCVSLKVGAIVAVRGRVVATGYNGTPSGFLNCCDVHKERGPAHTEWSNKYEIHAEMNCILFAARSGISLEGGIMYSTIEPCFGCLKNLAQSGIRAVFYRDPYYREQTDEMFREKVTFLKGSQLSLLQFDPQEDRVVIDGSDVAGMIYSIQARSAGEDE